MNVNSSLITVFYDRIYYIPIKSFWTNILRYVDDKGHSCMPCVYVVSRCLPHVRLELYDSLCNLISLYIIIVTLLSYLFCFCSLLLIYFCVESFLERILLLKGSFFTHYLTILYCINMPCVLIINLYYTSKINIIHNSYKWTKYTYIFFG